MKKLSLALFILLTTSLVGAQVVLIDPGHGGAEGGAEGYLVEKNKKTVVYEKELTLRLAKALELKLKDNYRVFLTREKDQFISLNDRAKMADDVKADIIISIHFNSSPHKTATGVETYYLDNHKDKAVKKVESVENQNVTGEDFIINHILIDLAIGLTSKTSQQLAKLIHSSSTQSVKKFNVKNRGFKAGLFYVLALSKRPGVLIEAGFLSNPQELARISSESYLHDYAQGISEGVIDYFKSLKK
jgi:N-acetylmuramoyl-L-alanine amidase